MEGSHLPHLRSNVPPCGDPSAVDVVVIGLGANLGDRLATMNAAIARVAEIALLRAKSRVYETAPVGNTDQPPFLNAAVAVEYTRSPLCLLDELLRIERGLGRVRLATARWGPRIIDLDVLWAGALVLDTPRLVVPHPRLRERAFAVAPLLDVVPEAIDPRTGERYLAPSGQGIQVTELRLRDAGSRSVI